MAQGSQTVPPPPTGDPNTDVQGAGNGGGMDRFRSIISRLSGGGTPAIDKALKAHHDQVVADAQRHADTAKRYYAMVAKAKQDGKDPTTGQPVTPEQLQQWQQMADGAWADYSKIAGKSKQAKPIIQQMGGLLKHIAGAGGGAQGQPGQQGTQTVQPPPQGAPSATTQPTVPPPPGTNPLQESAAGAVQDASARHVAEQSDLDAASKRRLDEKKTETDIAAKDRQSEREAEIKAQSTARQAEDEAKHKAKMAEIDEAAKAKALHATSHTASSDEDKFQRALEKSDYVAAKKVVTKAQDDYDSAIDRQTTMDKNAADILKAQQEGKDNQQAMLSLVANHIGMTLGAQKGARITRAVWDEATGSAPWLARIDAHFDSDGYLKGVVLTNEQVNQMVGLAHDKVGILKDHVNRMQDRYKNELSVKGRGRTVTTPPDGSSKKIKVSAEDMANAGR